MSLKSLCTACALWVCCSAPLGVAQESDELFQFRPSTPERQVRGAMLAEQLRRPELGRGYLRDLIDSQPGTTTLMDLRQKFGIGAFLKLSRTTSLQPESRELLVLLNQATRESTEAIGNLEDLIAELGRSEKRTTDAAVQILSFENKAVPALLAADPATESGEICNSLLRQYVRRFRYGLNDAMVEANQETQIRILNLLNESRAEELGFDLLPYAYSDRQQVASAASETFERLTGRPAPANRSDASRQLLMAAIELLKDADRPFPGSAVRVHDRNLQDRQAGYSIPKDESVFGKGLVGRAAELATIATGLSGDPSVETMQMLTAEVVDAWPLRWPEGAVEIAGPDSAATAEGEGLLQAAIATDNSAALFVALSNPDVQAVVQQTNGLWRTLLNRRDGRNRLLVAAVIAKVSPEYGPAQQVLAAASNAASAGDLVVIDSRPNDANSSAAALRQMGYDATGVFTGQAGFEEANRRLMNDLIVVHSNCLRWPLSMTIANLRADQRLASVPIVIYGPERDRSRTEYLLDNYRGLSFQVEPVSELTFLQELKLQSVPLKALTEEERLAMRAFAVGMQ